MNFGANAVLLVAKLMVALLTNSLSVLASLVDGMENSLTISEGEGIADSPLYRNPGLPLYRYRRNYRLVNLSHLITRLPLTAP